MKDQNCAYCMQGDLVAKFAYPVCQMKTGYLYLFKEQSKRGRVVLAYKDHVSEMIDISDEDRIFRRGCTGCQSGSQSI